MMEGLGLEGTYGATIDRIKSQDGDKSVLGMAALMWLSHAQRPLKADELSHALAVELGSADFNVSNTPSMATLVCCCQGLITVEKEASTVRLIHFTLQEYLSLHPETFSRPHSRLADICITYLSSKRVKALSADPSPDIIGIPFLRYSAVYWGVHAKRELSGSTRSLALKLLQQYDGHISTNFLLAEVPHLDLAGFGTCFPFSGLHCVSFLGIAELISALLGLGCHDINGEDFGGRTPLSWAAWNGHEGVVKALLGQDEAHPDKPDNEGRTPLSYAAWGGNGGVVEILLGREDVHPGIPTNYGHTPLSYAAWHGCEEVVKMLLRREEVNPDEPSNHGQTPLSYAAWGGREGVVEILLKREEVDPDRPDNDSRTPLWYAAWKGHGRVVKMLLGQKQVDPSKPDHRGQIPLSCAVRSGHEEVAQILLEREDVDPEKPDNGGRAPLWYAVRFGRGRVVRMLLERSADPTRPDTNGQTPLMLAPQHANSVVIELLEAWGAVNHITI